MLSVRGGKFVFTFQVPPAYPHEPPKVKCKTKVTRKKAPSEFLTSHYVY